MSGERHRIGVISDTHGLLHPRVFRYFEGVDLILHSGDVQSDSILSELEAIAPVQAVGGNVDPPGLPDLPAERRVETPLGRIAMTHGHLWEAPSTNLDQMKSFFDDFDPEIIIYGHSHIPKIEQIEGVWMFNPGAAGRPRFGRPPTVGLIESEADGGLRLTHRDLGWPLPGLE